MENKYHNKVVVFGFVLTHLSLVSLLWDIGKQNSPRCDVPSGAILFAVLFAKKIFIKKNI